MTDQEHRDVVALLASSQRELARLLRSGEETNRRIRESRKETDRELREMARVIQELGKQIGGQFELQVPDSFEPRAF